MPVFHDPNTAILALVVGLLGILFEFHAPGTILPGVVGAALVLLSAATLSQYPLSPGAISLIAIATCMLVLEVKVLSHGFLAVPGAILLASGIYLLVDSPDPSLHISPVISVGVVLPVALLTAFLVTIASRAARNKSIVGPNSIVGKTGTVIASPHLRVQVSGEYWNATSPNTLAPGTIVRVDSVKGLKLAVSSLHDKIVRT